MGTGESGGEAIGYPVIHQHYYAPLDPNPAPPILVRRRRRCCRSGCLGISYALSFLAMGLVVWMLYPAQVKIEVSKTDFTGMSWGSLKEVMIAQQQANDLGLDLNLKFQVQFRIRNPNLFGVRYDKIVVGLGYRGDNLGHVVLESGEIPALRVVTVDGVMDLKGSKVFVNAARMLVDIAKGRLPLETDIDFSGDLDFLFVKPHLQARLSCDIVVNPDTNDILDQSCLLKD